MKKSYHFIGIGGIGMSALAHILLSREEKVSGSDIKDSLIVQQLREKGAKIYLGHDERNVEQATCVIYSTDIAKDNPEYQRAMQLAIPLLHRSDLLAQLMEGYAPILVTGTHGKTTTSSLLAYVLFKLGLDPSFAVGGIIRGIGVNGRHGKGIYFAAEADESDGTFLRYPSFGAIVTNLDRDHLNFWKDEDGLIQGFKKFSDQVGSFQHLFWCKDDFRLSQLQLNGYSYGFSEEADLKIDNFQQMEWKSFFDLSFAGKHYKDIQIPLIGAHNVLNAAAVIGMSIKLDLPIEAVRNALLSFEGVGRRVEKKGTIHSIDVYDDYAHHPTEIFATLRALKAATHGRRLVVIFQPHRYTRTKDCIEAFPESFDYADLLILTDISAARESPIQGITSESFLHKIKEKASIPVRYFSRGELAKCLVTVIKPGDVVVTMGAGDITFVGPELLEELKTHLMHKERTSK
ncbi:MAG: UDP-N-acetylmuramate--L-alanine ligase [Chlamydiae bacterium]|nr:UDP-N-acetylmuramate--L-alanine ligase [Chlamydiota bacterium]